MTKKLANEVALVTGAGSGIGREVAVHLAAAGAKVVVSDIDEAGGSETVARIRKHDGRCEFMRADTSSADESARLVEFTVQTFGALHVAVNNAGIGGPIAPIAEYPLDGWQRVIDVNLSGVFYGMRAQIPAMLQAGRGSIINMTSILGQVGFRNSAAYVAAKHGVVGLTKNAALEYGTRNVRINAVAPGFIHTPMVDNALPADALKVIEGLHAVGRLGTPAEVATLVTWLASHEASFVTGGYYAVDGGYLAQ
jgi:NAD(P)-dependent dehydrogenase (short-subunit alcohol dehydrogenase family)